MSIVNPVPWRPRKVLLVPMVACVLVSMLVVAEVAHWVASIRTHHERAVAVAQVERRPQMRPHVMQTAFVDPPKARPSHKTAPAPGNESDPARPLPGKGEKNAILASVPGHADPLPGDDLFKEAQIPKLQIHIPSEGISSLERKPRKYVRATILEGTKFYTNVAIHLKGGPGSYRQLDDYPAFTLNFDRFEEGQTFHGLKKIHLNNSVQDRSFLSEKICRELMEAAGVPVPRGGNAFVTFNRRELGMYVLLEGVNKQFLKRYFKDAKGNVYDGHSGSDVTGNMPTNSGEDRTDKSRLRALGKAAQESDRDVRLASLEKTLDVDRFLSFLAMEMILWHWDGYTMNRNNFRIFHDRTTDRMVFIPHGMDQMFSKPHGQIFPQTQGLVARAVLDIPEMRQRYLDRVAELTTNVFKAELITARIREAGEKIEAVLDEQGASGADAHRQKVASFCRRVQQRANYLQNQVSPVTPLHFGDLAMASLTNWQTKIDLGDAQLNEEKDPEGNVLLHISTKEGCTASWRTTCPLDSGKYRFEARVRTKGVVLPTGDSRAGAGLRISRYRVGQKNAGDRDWTPVAFEFDVQEESDVELICELRANEGDIWFDEKSLVLKRR